MTGGKIMKTKAILYSAFALLAIACTKENLVENNENNQDQNSEVRYVPMELSAMTEGSKTVLGEVSADGVAVDWLSADQISIFDNAEGANNQFSIKSFEKGEAVFSGDVPSEATEFFALYPYRNSKFDKDTKVISSYLNPNQPAKLGSFATTYAHMAGVLQDNTIEFKNLFNHIQFTIAEDIKDVKSITLMGNKGETLAGSYDVSFKTGEPVLTATSPEIYVTLKSSGEEALKPGVYYFSIFPTNLESGFTVILSKTDGSQKAISKDTAIDLSQRNTILLTKTAESAKYTDHMNYFVKYNDEFELTFGGQTISKDNYPTATFTSDITIGQDGLYFIHSNGTATIDYNTASNLAVIGSDKSTRSTLKLSKNIQPVDNGTLVLYANLSCVTEKRIIEQKTFTNFGAFVISNCDYQITNRYGLLFNAVNSTIESIAIEDSNFGIETATDKNGNYYTDMYFMNWGSKTSSINNLQVTNSIIYSLNQSITKIVDFRLVHAPSTSFGKTDISNNTLVGLKTRIPTSTKSGLIYASAFNSTTILKNNYMVECQVEGTSSDSMIYLVYATSIGENFTRDFQHNYVYSTINPRVMTFSDCFTPVGSSAPQGVRKMNGNPLNDNWNPAKGIYGAYKAVTYGTSSSIPTSVGAKRPDMVTPANTAAYRYAPNELGSF